MPLPVRRDRDPEATDRILRSLPEWFGIEEAIQTYVALAGTQDSYLVAVADSGGATIGVALVHRHFDESAELTLIAVDAEHRGVGHGRRLIHAVEAQLRRKACQYLEVHTVGPSFEDAGYAATRAFYRAMGFSPMHEYDNLDWDGPPLVMVRRL